MISLSKLSIIVPFYNAAATLDRCCNSIMRQGIDDFEVFLINDGSSDQSKNIGKKWMTIDSRFKLFSQENAGPSMARNYALERITGDVIIFLDGDDELLPNTLKENLSIIHNHPDTDLVIFPLIKMAPDNTTTSGQEFSDERFYSHQDVITLWSHNSKKISGHLAGKMYRSYLWKKIRLPKDIRFAEDMYVLSDILYQVKKLFFSKRGGYIYHFQAGSATNSSWTAQKAAGIASASIHRWQVAVIHKNTLENQIYAWKYALALVVRTYQEFMSPQFYDHLHALIKHNYTWQQLYFSSPSIRSFTGLLINYIKLHFYHSTITHKKNACINHCQLL